MRSSGIVVSAFADRFAWIPERMATDIETAMTNGCGECGEPYLSLADVTLDIIDRSRPPDYATNCRWICLSDNREKSQTPPDRWSEYRYHVRRWVKRKAERETDPWAGTLFEGSGYR